MEIAQMQIEQMEKTFEDPKKIDQMKKQSEMHQMIEKPFESS